MRKTFISPLKYIQCEDALKLIGEYVKLYGKTAFVVASKEDYLRVKAQVDESAVAHGVKLVVEDFNGECSYKEINRLKGLAKKANAEVFIGLGGGKAIDTCKVVASGKPIIIAPTIASTDAPTSHVSVIYTEHGTVEAVEFIRQNPEVVLVDTKVIVNAPARLLVSGMGDALATYFEARSSHMAGAPTIAGGLSTIAGQVLSRACYDILLRDGVSAKKACESKTINPSFENVVEANTLLSGLGFESGGLAAAHAIHDGLTVLPQTHNMWHGEKVAFGTLTHLVLEKAPTSQINEVLKFCLSVGLPVCLSDLGINNITKDELKQVADFSCHAKSFIHSMPFKVTPDMVADAIMMADKLGRKAKGI